MTKKSITRKLFDLSLALALLLGLFAPVSSVSAGTPPPPTPTPAAVVTPTPKIATATSCQNNNPVLEMSITNAKKGWTVGLVREGSADPLWHAIKTLTSGNMYILWEDKIATKDGGEYALRFGGEFSLSLHDEKGKEVAKLEDVYISNPCRKPAPDVFVYGSQKCENGQVDLTITVVVGKDTKRTLAAYFNSALLLGKITLAKIEKPGIYSYKYSGTLKSTSGQVYGLSGEPLEVVVTDGNPDTAVWADIPGCRLDTWGW